jgi:hypothetical protein
VRAHAPCNCTEELETAPVSRRDLKTPLFIAELLDRRFRGFDLTDEEWQKLFGAMGVLSTDDLRFILQTGKYDHAQELARRELAIRFPETHWSVSWTFWVALATLLATLALLGFEIFDHALFKK